MKKWLVPLAVSILATAIWWTHHILANVYPPFENRIDDAMWIFTSISKYIILISIPFALNRVFRHCDGIIDRSVKASVVWMLTGLMLLTVLSVFRVQLANSLNNETIRFFPTTDSGLNQSDEFLTPLFPSAIADWQNGSIFVTEAFAIILCAAMCGVIAYRSKLLGRTSPGIIATIALAVITTAVSIGCKLLVLDYDNFMAGTLLPPITLDLFFPLAYDPPTEISLLACLCLILSSFFMDLKWSRLKLQPSIR